jgi:ADP-ribose pyrophosphatase YjhB (NUDIX family)
MPLKESYIQWLRRSVGKRRIFMIGSVAAIRDESGQILAMRRADNGIWCPPGGAMELGETLISGLVREVKEETGLRIVPFHLVGLYTSPDLQTYTYPNGDQIQSWSAFFECRIVGGRLRAVDGEALELRFFTPEQAPFTFPVFERMMADLLAPTTEAAFDGLCSRDGLPKPSEEDYFRFLRRFVGQAPIMAPAAAAFIRDDRGRILLQRRHDNELWGLPGGGQNLGESAPEAMMREVYEETGLYAEPERLIGVYGDPAFAKTYPNGDQVQPAIALFEARVTGGQLNTRSPETLELAFFGPGQLPPMQYCCQVKVQDALEGTRSTAFR